MEIRAIAEMRINPDSDPDAVAELVKKISKRTVEQDPGTVAHNYYMDRERRVLIAHEHYANSREMIAHLDNMDPEVMQSLLGSVELSENRVFGDASEELRNKMEAFGGTEFFEHISGFTRTGVDA
jgi:quinol monooxygenase YgiN